MMGFRLTVPTLLVLLLSSVARADGMDDVQLAAVQKLGELNGMALNCHYLIETRRMKKTLVLTLPKRRQYGELFDSTTNTAFLKILENRTGCPEEGVFSEQVDAAILELEAAFAN